MLVFDFGIAINMMKCLCQIDARTVRRNNRFRNPLFKNTDEFPDRSPENASVLMPKACGIIQVSKVSKKAFVHSSTGHVVTVSQDGPWESPSQGIYIY